MFPEYKCFINHPWNRALLTPRQHFIAHKFLHLIFKGSSQSRCFFYLSNKYGTTQSKMYHEASLLRSNNLRGKKRDRAVCEKISTALKGKAKSVDHRRKLSRVKSEDEIEKLRIAATGRKWSLEKRRKFSLLKTGKSRAPHTEAGKRNISTAKKNQKLKWYNNGIIESQLEVCPANWRKGRLKSHVAGRSWYNNGKENKMFFNCPDNSWVKGRLKINC